jgi:hypothetical protein
MAGLGPTIAMFLRLVSIVSNFLLNKKSTLPSIVGTPLVVIQSESKDAALAFMVHALRYGPLINTVKLAMNSIAALHSFLSSLFSDGYVD